MSSLKIDVVKTKDTALQILENTVSYCAKYTTRDHGGSVFDTLLVPVCRLHCTMHLNLNSSLFSIFGLDFLQRLFLEPLQIIKSASRWSFSLKAADSVGRRKARKVNSETWFIIWFVDRTRQVCWLALLSRVREVIDVSNSEVRF